MMLSDLQSKDIINVVDGKHIGMIVDVSVNKEGKLTEISVQKRKFFFFNSSVVTLTWEQIDKIGKDVILVNITG